jgi:PilZ domain
MTASPLNYRAPIHCTRLHRPKPPAPELIGEDRRSNRRYEVELEVRWRLNHRKRLLDSGSGRTLDLSSGGVRLETNRELPVGLRVCLSIAWPILLNDTTRLQLIIEGKVVRSSRTWAAIRTERHEFRTAVVCKPSRAHG